MIENREAGERGHRKKVGLNLGLGCKCNYFDTVLSCPCFCNIVIKPEAILRLFYCCKFAHFCANLEILAGSNVQILNAI